MKKGQLNSIAYYFINYIPFGAICVLLSQYLNGIGFSGTQVGTITALSTCGAALGNLILGRTFSNTKHKRVMLAIILLCCGTSVFVLRGIKTFIPFAFMYFVSYFFQEPVHGLSDAMINQSGKNFAFIRAFGAIGYAIASYATGLVCNKYGLDKIFIIGSIAYLTAIIFILREDEPKTYVKQDEKVKISDLFKNKTFVKLLVSSFFIFGMMLSNNTYFSYLFLNGGGDIAGVGLAFLLMAGSEAIFMALIPKFEKKCSLEKLILIAIITEIARFGFYAMGPSYKLLLATFILQGIMDGILLVEMVKYFQNVVLKKQAMLSVAVLNSIGINLSTIFTNFTGGIVLDKYGANGVYFYFAMLSTIGLVLYLAFGLHKEKRPQNF